MVSGPFSAVCYNNVTCNAAAANAVVKALGPTVVDVVVVLVLVVIAQKNRGRGVHTP